MKTLVLLFGGLVVWGAVTGKSAGSGGPPSAATEIPTSGGHGGALVGVLVVVALVGLVAKAGGRGRAVASDHRQVRGPAQDGDGSHWSPTERRSIERHEKRHQRVADAFGVGGNWWVHDHGGSFQRNNDSHLSGVQRAAISYAGNGGSWWAGSPCDQQDEANGDGYIESAYPRGEWSERKREARALARRLS
jgi:hypothetical protein